MYGSDAENKEKDSGLVLREVNHKILLILPKKTNPCIF